VLLRLCPWEVREAITKKFDPKLENIFCNMMEHFVRLQAGATIEPIIAYTVNGAFYMDTSTVMEHGHGGPRDRFVTRTTVHSDIWTLWNCQQAERLSEILTHEDWKRWETGFRDRCPGLLHGVANPCTISLILHAAPKSRGSGFNALGSHAIELIADSYRRQ